MNVFVTGGAGYIGSVCVELLLDSGHQVTVFDHLENGHRAAVDRRATLVVGDLADASAVKETLQRKQFDAIIHFAGSTLVPESMTNPAKYFRNNVGSGLNLLEGAVAAKIPKFVFSSTCATYGPPDRIPMTEDLPQRPISPYGESKFMFEKILQWFNSQHGLEFVAFRYFNAAGASKNFGEDHRPETHLIPNVLKVALGLLPHCEVFGTDYPTPDGTCIRDYIHIIDLADAHIRALERGKQGFFNLGNGDGYSVRQVIETCERVTGKSIRVVERPRRPGDPPRLVAAAGKAKSDLGWNPKFPRLLDIVSTAWDWHVRHPKGYC